MSKGFATDNLTSKKLKKKVILNEPQGRLISWSPWPPANFQTRYPAFPFCSYSINHSSRTMVSISTKITKKGFVFMFQMNRV